MSPSQRAVDVSPRPVALTVDLRSRVPEVPLEEWEASPAGDERDDDVGGVPVEVLSTSVVNGRRPRVGVAGGDLYIA